MISTRGLSLALASLATCGVALACTLRVPEEDSLFTEGSDLGPSAGGSAGSSAGQSGSSATAGAAGSGGTAGSSEPAAGGAGGSAGEGSAGSSSAGSGGTVPFDPSSELVLYYPFDESSGSVVHDQNDSAMNGTIYGEPVWLTAGRKGGALQLSGKTEDAQYVQLPRDVLVDHDAVTVATWYRWDGGNSWQRVFDLGSGPPSWLYYSPLTDVGARVAVHEPATNLFFDIIIVNPPSVGEWAHVTVSWTEARMDVYLNGERVASKAEPGIVPPQLGGTVQNWIGRSQFTPDPFFAGVIDDFRIYSRALSESDVAQLYAE